MECLNQTGTTALQKILCPTYQSCGTYCQQDCMSYDCSSTYTAITRRTYVSSATLPSMRLFSFFIVALADSGFHPLLLCAQTQVLLQRRRDCGEHCL